MLITIATILAILAESRYIWSIITGKTRPNFSAWAIFTLAMFCVLVSSYSLGATSSLFVVATFATLHLATTVLSYKYGITKLTTFEKTLLSLTIISVILWMSTDNPWHTFLINISIDTFGYMCLVYKLYLHPDTEDYFAWILSVMSYGLNLFVFAHWVPQEYLFSILNVFWGVVILALIFIKKKEVILMWASWMALFQKVYGN